MTLIYAFVGVGILILLYVLGRKEALGYGIVLVVSSVIGSIAGRIVGDDFEWVVIICSIVILRYGGWWVWRKLKGGESTTKRSTTQKR